MVLPSNVIPAAATAFWASASCYAPMRYSSVCLQAVSGFA